MSVSLDSRHGFATGRAEVPESGWGCAGQTRTTPAALFWLSLFEPESVYSPMVEWVLWAASVALVGGFGGILSY